MISPPALAQEGARAMEAVRQVIPAVAWPEVPIGWNRRMRRAGRAVLRSCGRRLVDARIELSPAYFEVYPQDLHGILVHEAVHVALAALGLRYGHGPLFRRFCSGAGGLLHARPMPGRVFRYRCPVCDDVVERRRRIASDRWCARCAEAAQRCGNDPFEPGRALILVATAFSGPVAHDEAPDALP
jgi:predicted SprT family Zn-dependent metalloprotease